MRRVNKFDVCKYGVIDNDVAFYHHEKVNWQKENIKGLYMLMHIHPNRWIFFELEEDLVLYKLRWI